MRLPRPPRRQAFQWSPLKGRHGRPLMLATGGVFLCAAVASLVSLPASVSAGPTLEVASQQSTGDSAAGESSSCQLQAASQGRMLALLPWGEKEGEVGLVRPTEGLARGPESLAIAPDGRIAVLDSVNKRVVCLDQEGRFLLASAVPLAEPRFIAVDDDVIYVLDCDRSRLLTVVDWQGEVLATAALPDLPDVVTALFATPEGPCVEVVHEKTFLLDVPDRIAASGQAPSAEPAGDEYAADTTPQNAAGNGLGRAIRPTLSELPGRPLRGPRGNTARLAKIRFRPDVGVQMQLFTAAGSAGQRVSSTRSWKTFASGLAVEHLVSVDGDSRGGLIIGARLANPGSSGRKQADDGAATVVTQATTDRSLQAATEQQGRPALLLKRVDPSGDPSLEQTMFLSDYSIAYVGQPYVVAPDGRVFQPVAYEEGYCLLVHEFAPSADARGLEEETTTCGEEGES